MLLDAMEPQDVAPGITRRGLPSSGQVLARAYDSADERDEAGGRIWDEYDRILAQDQALDRSDWWSEFYAGVRKQST